MENLTDPTLPDAVQDLNKPEECPVKKDDSQTPEVCMDSWFLGLSHFGPLKFVLKLLEKIAALVPLSVEDGSSQISSPSGRRCVSGKKRLGRLLRFLFFITPHWLQCMLGYPKLQDIGDCDAPEEVKTSPLKPWGKGSKRKQDDVDLEEQQSWIEVLQEDLPDEDEDDSTYEPSKSETDSEEGRSKNDTETDLEFEERDGVVMLKESQVTEEVELRTSETCTEEVEEVKELKTSETCEEQDTSADGKIQDLEGEVKIQDSPQRP